MMVFERRGRFEGWEDHGYEATLTLAFLMMVYDGYEYFMIAALWLQEFCGVDLVCGNNNAFI